MLYKFFLTLLIIDSVVLVLAILLQAGQGGGLAATFGGVSSSTNPWFGARQTGNLLTKASWWCGGIFLGLAFALSLASTRSRTPTSVLDQAIPAAPQQTAPATAPGAPGGAAPIPLEPAPSTPAPTGTAPAPQTKTP